MERAGQLLARITAVTGSSIIGQLLIGWLLADLIGGFLHWVEDRVLTEDMPLLGAAIVRPNRRHHREPLAFTAGSFLDRNLSTFIAAGAVSLVWAMLLGPSLIWAAATLGGAIQSIVHGLAHQPKAAVGPLRVLQETGLIQSPKHHARHHRPPSDGRYCILTDWLNPSLDAIGFWTSLERALLRLGFRPSLGER
jgi:ubiquitin-conjugating enzyme E2 variant